MDGDILMKQIYLNTLDSYIILLLHLHQDLLISPAYNVYTEVMQSYFTLSEKNKSLINILCLEMPCLSLWYTSISILISRLIWITFQNAHLLNFMCEKESALNIIMHPDV